ncbi:hypothetical protein QKU89_gp2 [Metaplexis yellow mottle-associated virus]|uniref:Aphid transmission protein n=1 Tax=Metaplexis yellow mottle-associated virus TaxID=2878269 RepID=A0A8K1M848_9VIRU|nr:hypothetical protein QKU89_gp2 [Metaplexis yellow mottle-associated virus]UBN09110.1 hypothetical protein [Metaplexis yellow mottle-associated virus]
MTFNSNPHIYFEKKYIAINRHDVVRGNANFYYTSGSGIQGCLGQLNNVNSIAGGCLILLSQICYKLGIKNLILKDELESKPTKGFADLIPSSSENPLKKDLEDISRKMSVLQKQVESIEDKLKSFDKEILEKILRHAESVDSKT